MTTDIGEINSRRENDALKLKAKSFSKISCQRKIFYLLHNFSIAHIVKNVFQYEKINY